MDGGFLGVNCQTHKAALKDCPVYEESSRTFLIDVEFTVNNRSLLPLSDNINDLDVLTRDHFLIGTQHLHFNPNIKCEKIDSRIRWKASISYGHQYHTSIKYYEKENLKLGRYLILRFWNFSRVKHFAKMIKNWEI